jgi:hypothetical protein
MTRDEATSWRADCVVGAPGAAAPSDNSRLGHATPQGATRWNWRLCQTIEIALGD